MLLHADDLYLRPSPDGPRGVKPSPLYPAGRVCDRFECITILCRYDPGPSCYVHDTDEFRPTVSSAA